MQRPRLLGLALLAMFALCAVASTTALAQDPRFLSETGKFPVSFTGTTSRSTVFETTKLAKITCIKDTDTGEIESASFATVTIALEGCSTFASLKCHTPGDATGVILFPAVSLYLVSYSRAGKLLAGLLSKLPPVLLEFLIECGSGPEKVKIRGGVIGLLSPLGSFGKNFTLSFEQVAGVPSVRECDFPIEVCGKAGERKPFFLETSINGGSEEEAGEEGVEELETSTRVEVEA
jgi:hypothetical protein